MMMNHFLFFLFLPQVLHTHGIYQEVCHHPCLQPTSCRPCTPSQLSSRGWPWSNSGSMATITCTEDHCPARRTSTGQISNRNSLDLKHWDNLFVLFHFAKRKNLTLFPIFIFQPAEEGERQAAVTSQGRQRLTGAGHGKLLQSCYIQFWRTEKAKWIVREFVWYLVFIPVKDFF